MATEERTNTRIPECEFQWSECDLLMKAFPDDGVITHMCRRDKDHDGLHGCGDCGVVYLKRRA